MPRAPAIAARAGVIALITTSLGTPVSAQRVPVRCYDAADGFVQNWVRVVAQDSRGFLWIGTSDGVSRFDGYRFVAYGLADGLPALYINDILEDRRGRLWFATNGGGLALLPAAPSTPEPRQNTFVGLHLALARSSLSADQINALAPDATGEGLWCATDGGLFHARLRPDGVLAGEPVASFEHMEIGGLHVDRRGRLWLYARAHGIFVIDNVQLTHDLRAAAGAPLRMPFDAMAASQHVSFDEDIHGVIRIVAPRGMYELAPRPFPEAPVAVARPAPPLPADHTLAAVRSDSAGRLWIGSTAGLFEEQPNASAFGAPVGGLGAGTFVPEFEDRDGNVWVAALGRALCRASPMSIESFTAADGLPEAFIERVVKGPAGRIYAVTDAGVVEVQQGSLVPVSGSRRPPFNRIGRRILASRDGWWAMLEDGLLHLPGPRLRFDTAWTRIPVRTTYAQPVGLPGTIRSPGLVEQDGAIWFTAADGTLRRISSDPAKTKPPEPSIAAEGPRLSHLTVVEGDHAGQIWLASMTSLARYLEGRVEVVEPSDGLPETNVRSMHIDRRGRLWIGLRFRGLSMTTAPRDAHPRFVNYSTRNGLASDTVWAIAEDEQGVIYLGTQRGLDRLDPDTGRVRHFTTADGLAGNFITCLLNDGAGTLWVGTASGLSRFYLRADRRARAPAHIYVSGIRVAGEAIALPDRGVTEWAVGRVPASRNNLTIQYLSLDIRPGTSVRYQYKLDGVDGAWSEPTAERAITYARLAPGSYRFEVRAVDTDGRVSPHPAVATFTIAAPFWRAGWFFAALALVAVAAALSLHRLRTRHLLAVERVRRQVATDLHDDLGSGLSQIAILSEVSKRGVAVHGHLDEIAVLARSLRESMDDIVWAIDPRKDRLADVIGRMRQVAVNSLESAGVALAFHAPDAADLERLSLASDKRRHLLLIVKEAVTNVARHARASNVEIRIEIDRRELRVCVRDDGRGFDRSRRAEGHGLHNLARRSADIGADLIIESSRGRGTSIQVRFPLRT